MPGIGEVIDGAMQQAPQWLRHWMAGFRQGRVCARGAFAPARRAGRVAPGIGFGYGRHG
jgi:hypothetical protein